MSRKMDIDLYLKMSQPKTKDEANAALSAFLAELEPLREKHGITDFSFVLSVNVKYGEDHGIARTCGHYGNSIEAESMLAWAFGQSQSERKEKVNKLLAGKAT